MLFTRHNIMQVLRPAAGHSRWRQLCCYLLWLILSAGCAKFIDVGPPKSETIIGGTVYTNNGEATGALVGIYGRMIRNNAFAAGYTRSVTFLAGLSADELTSYSGVSTLKQFYENTVHPANEVIETALWNDIYQYIYSANAVWAGVQNPGIAIPVREQLQGEALFIRAFCYFYLVNLYGDVPLITTTNYEQNMRMGRTSKAQVYNQVIADLKAAKELLDDNYVTGETERVRPNRSAVTALLARVYLYTEDWENAAALAGAVINNTKYALSDSLDKVFLAGSPEAIWQLKPNTPAINTWEGYNFILLGAPSMVEASATTLSPQLLRAFEAGDQRRSTWVDSVAVDTAVYYFPYKYRIKNSNNLLEYTMVLRLAEQYLVRAEARTHLGNYAGARNDINIIRKRAGLPAITVTGKEALLAAVQQERWVELFTEWGHRWLDLKRSKLADAILGPLKGPSWKSTAVLYPIPQNEITKNINLQPQNPGYE